LLETFCDFYLIITANKTYVLLYLITTGNILYRMYVEEEFFLTFQLLKCRVTIDFFVKNRDILEKKLKESEKFKVLVHS